MKISKDRLKQIIQEELAVGVAGEKEHGGHKAEQTQFDGGDYAHDKFGYEGRMAKTNLWKIAEYAKEMHDLIHDDEDLEPWVEEKIAVAAYMMDSVGHYLQYEKHRGHEEEKGEPEHAEDHEEHGDDEEYELVIGDDSEDEEQCEDC